VSGAEGAARRSQDRGDAGRIVPGAPSWIRTSAAAAFLVLLACLAAAHACTGRIGSAIRGIESAHTIMGWRNEPAIAEAVRIDPVIEGCRAWRTVFLAGSGLGFAALAGLAVAASADRRRRAEALARIREDLKQDRMEEIRGFISQHVGVLAQKKIELMTSNEYGVADDAEWQREITYFVNRVLRPGCAPAAESFSFLELRSMVERQMRMLG
jgi:hypothetical protein